MIIFIKYVKKKKADVALFIGWCVKNCMGEI